ncbi:unnamed protein product [Caenorhabditis brenneri]
MRLFILLLFSVGILTVFGTNLTTVSPGSAKSHLGKNYTQGEMWFNAGNTIKAFLNAVRRNDPILLYNLTGQFKFDMEIAEQIFRKWDGVQIILESASFAWDDLVRADVNFIIEGKIIKWYLFIKEWPESPTGWIIFQVEQLWMSLSAQRSKVY